MKNVARQFAHWNWALLDQALVSGSNFLVGILLVRYLGIEQYGMFVLAWMIVQFFASLQNALIVSPMLSITPKFPIEQRGDYLSSTFFLQACLALLIVILGLVYIVVPSQYKPILITDSSIAPIILCLGSVQIQDYMRRNLFARMQSRRAFHLDAITYGVQLPLIFIVLEEYPSVESALLVTAIGLVSAILVGYRWLEISTPFKTDISRTAVRHWRSSRWLLGSAILQWMSGNYFMVVAGLMLGPTVVGAIRAAQNLLGLSHVLFQALENIVPGEASNRYQDGGPQALIRYICKIAILMIVGTALVAAPAAIFAEPLLRLVYGTFDQGSAKAIAWFIPIYLLVAINLPLRAALRSLERTGAVFIAYVGSTVFALTAAEHLVKPYGIDGVMAGITTVQIITTAVLSTSLLLELRGRWKLDK